MRHLVLALLLPLCLSASHAQYSSFPPGAFQNRAALDPTTGGGGGGCSDSVTFLARGSFDAGHTTAYQNFICGLNTDGIGIFTNAWDVLVILGTQNSTVAALNLPSTSFSPAANGSPTFTADQGYAGVDASGTVYLDTNYNANTSGINFTSTSAHISVWSYTNTTSGTTGGACIAAQSGITGSRIFPKYNDGNTYADINVSASNTLVAAQSSAIGLFFVDRNGTAENYYYNGNTTPIATATNAANAVINTDFVVLASSNLGVVTFGCGNTISAYSLGRHFTTTEMNNFYSRLRTLGTALGWP